MTVPSSALEAGEVVSAECSDCAAGLISERSLSPELAVSAESLSGEAARRLACDAGIVEVEVNERGEPLSVGRRTRTIPAAIKRALLVRDKTCRFPGCSNRLFLDGHHIQHWADGGETKLDNLALICAFHHKSLHQHGYSIEVAPDGALVFRDSFGEVIPATGERPRWESRKVGRTAIAKQNEGLGLHAATGACKWNGRAVNYQLVVNALVRMQDQGAQALQQ